MARWRLTEGHYLKVDGTKWEFTQINRINGRPMRKQFDVPLYLNPMDLDDLRLYGQGSAEEDEREIIVSNGTGAQPKDVVFIGDPTPGMVPLDDEAKEITARCSKDLWTPTQGTDDESQSRSFVQKMMSGMIDDMSKLRNDVATAPVVPGMAEFMQTMGAMMQQQTEILAQLAKAQSVQHAARRGV